MNLRRLTLLALAFVPSLSFAQEARPPARPTPVVSPEIKDGGNVVFRLKAPKAHEVIVRAQWASDPIKLTMAEDGTWTGESAAVPAGVWEYSFLVDGLAMIDPGNPDLKPMREPRSSILHIAAKEPAPWDFQNVPHGTVHQHSYYSTALKKPRQLVVYTPPGYEGGSDKFPLLVLQHGSGDNEQTWVTHGKANWIFDNLIATKKARPMIVLMINGHPLGRTAFGDPTKRGEAMKAFQDELFGDAIPLVENDYRVERTRDARAITGLSMGAGQSLSAGLGHLERFAWVGAFSGAGLDDTALQALLADPAGANAKLRLLWIGIGQKDPGLSRAQEFEAKLKEKGITHQWHLTEGAHTWPVWRQYLVDFAPLLFQPSGHP